MNQVFKKIITVALLSTCMHLGSAMQVESVMQAPQYNKDLDSDLINAIDREDIEETRKLLEKRADPNACNHNTTALIKAASRGNTDMVKMLLAAHADINMQDAQKSTALIEASFKGHVNTVKVLLDAHANVDTQDAYESTALIQASSQGHIAIVRMLLDAQADINMQDSQGYTALIMAVYENNKELAQMLLLHVKNDPTVVNKQDKMGNTALTIAVAENKTELCELLLQAGADIKIKNKHGMSPLSIASARNQTTIFEMLLHTVTNAGEEEQATLTEALSQALRNNRIDVAKRLIEAKANINAEGVSYLPALHQASLRGLVEIVKILIAAKADINAQCNKKSAHIHEAEGLDIFSLRKRTESYTDQKPINRTALMLIVNRPESDQTSYNECAEALLEAGTDISLYDNREHTALSLAKFNNNQAFIKLLIAKIKARIAEIREITFHAWPELPIDMLDFCIMPYLDPDQPESQEEKSKQPEK